jgi:hypothetical protein
VRVAACALVVVVISAGCGGGPAKSLEDAAVRQAVQRWLDAVVRHDGAAACALLSTRLRESINRHLLGEGVGGSCRTWAARWVSRRHPASHRGAHITGIRIEGAHATVALAAPGVLEGNASLVKENGLWRIDDF